MYDPQTLHAALIGYQLQREQITHKIEELNAKLKGKRVPMPSEIGARTLGRPAQVKHNISAEGRARIAEAQRKRWAAAKRSAAKAKKAAEG
jgi:hypothetical protein